MACTYDEAVVKAHPVRRGGGFTPKLTDAEVLTMEVGGEYFQQLPSKAIFRSFPLPPFLSPIDQPNIVYQAGRQLMADFGSQPTANR